MEEQPQTVLVSSLLSFLDSAPPNDDDAAWTLPWQVLSRHDEQALVDLTAQLRTRGEDFLDFLDQVCIPDFPSAVFFRCPHLLAVLLAYLQEIQRVGAAATALSSLLTKLRSDLAALVSLDSYARVAADEGLGGSPVHSSNHGAIAVARARAAAALAARIESRAAVREYLAGLAQSTADAHYTYAAELRRLQVDVLPRRRSVGLESSNVPLSGLRERFIARRADERSGTAARSLYPALDAVCSVLVEPEYARRFLLPARHTPLLCDHHDDASTLQLRALQSTLRASSSLLDNPVPIHRVCAAVAEAAMLALSQRAAPSVVVAAGSSASLAALARDALELAVDPFLSYAHDSSWTADAAECAQALVDSAACAIAAMLPLDASPAAQFASPACKLLATLEHPTQLTPDPTAVLHLFVSAAVDALLCRLPLTALSRDDESATAAAPSLEPLAQGEVCAIDLDGSARGTSSRLYTSAQLQMAARIQRCSVARISRVVRVPAALLHAGEALFLIAPSRSSTPARELSCWSSAGPRRSSLERTLSALGSSVPTDCVVALEAVQDVQALLSSRVGAEALHEVMRFVPIPQERAWEAASVVAGVSRVCRASLLRPSLCPGLVQSAAAALSASSSAAVTTLRDPALVATAALLTQVCTGC
jgi:hypothetical protein